MSADVWLCLCAYVCIDLLPRHDCVTGVGAQAGFYCPPGTSTADEFPCGSVVSVPAPTALPRCRDAPSVCDMTRVSPSPCTARLVVALPRLWMWVTTPRLLSTQPHSGRGNSCVTSGTTVLGDPWQLAHLECTQPCSLAVPSMPPELTSRRLSLLACFHVQVWKRARPELIHVQWPMRYWALRQCRGLDNAHVLRPMRSRLHLPCWLDQAHC